MLNLLGVTTLIEGIELTGLPEYYLVGVSTINCRLYSECRFRGTDSRSCADYPGRSYFDEYNDERDGSNLSSRMSFNRVKHRLGLFPGDQSVVSGYNERVNSVD